MKKHVALVTGASSGIGFDTAVDLKKKGFTVYGAARRMDKLEGLKSKGVNIISLDVTDEASTKKCVDTIMKNEGQIDVLVNNAGYGSYGAVEDVPMEEARRQFDVNIFGLARLTQLVLPGMRRNRRGRIINISSMGGKVHTPFGAWYHATKFALEGFSDCLRMEVARHGIEVVVVEPGGINTPWGVIAGENLKKTSAKGAYATQANSYADMMIEMYSSGKGLSPASLISKTIVKASTARKPKTRYLIGANAKPVFILKRLLSDRAYDRLISRMMGIR